MAGDALTMKVTAPNGATFEVNAGLNIDQVIQTLQAAGVANLAGAQAVRTVNNGRPEVRFAEPAGTQKGI